MIAAHALLEFIRQAIGGNAKAPSKPPSTPGKPFIPGRDPITGETAIDKARRIDENMRRGRAEGPRVVTTFTKPTQNTFGETSSAIPKITPIGIPIPGKKR